MFPKIFRYINEMQFTNMNQPKPLPQRAMEFLLFPTATTLIGVMVEFGMTGQISFALFAVVTIISLLSAGSMLVLGYKPRPTIQIFKKWRIGNSESEKIYLSYHLGREMHDGSWEIQFSQATETKCMIYGPYIRLKPGKYKIVYRIKIDDHLGNDRIGLVLHVSSEKANKTLARRDINIRDFKQSDVFQDFPIIVDVYKEEPDVEFRLQAMPATSGSMVIDYIELARLPY